MRIHQFSGFFRDSSQDSFRRSFKLSRDSFREIYQNFFIGFTRDSFKNFSRDSCRVYLGISSEIFPAVFTLGISTEIFIGNPLQIISMISPEVLSGFLHRSFTGLLPKVSPGIVPEILGIPPRFSQRLLLWSFEGFLQDSFKDRSRDSSLQDALCSR